MLYAIFSRASGLRQSRTQSMPVRRLGAGHAQHLTCERAYSGYEIALWLDESARSTAMQCSQRAARSFVRGLEIRLKGPLISKMLWSSLKNLLNFRLSLSRRPCPYRSNAHVLSKTLLLVGLQWAGEVNNISRFYLLVVFASKFKTTTYEWK